MTDSADDVESDRSDKGPSTSVDSQVPADAEWDLELQEPFDDEDNHDLTSAIIVGVAEAEGVSPTEIKDPPLYEVLDVAALEEALFGSSDIGRQGSDLRVVEFMYRSHRIVVRSDRWIQIYRSAEE